MFTILAERTNFRPHFGVLHASLQFVLVTTDVEVGFTASGTLLCLLASILTIHSLVVAFDADESLCPVRIG